MKTDLSSLSAQGAGQNVLLLPMAGDGYPRLYLVTDLAGFYEKYGRELLTMATRAIIMPGNACIRLPPLKTDPFDGGRPELRPFRLHAGGKSGAGMDCCDWNGEERRA